MPAASRRRASSARRPTRRPAPCSEPPPPLEGAAASRLRRRQQRLVSGAPNPPPLMDAPPRSFGRLCSLGPAGGSAKPRTCRWLPEGWRRGSSSRCAGAALCNAPDLEGGRKGSGSLSLRPRPLLPERLNSGDPPGRGGGGRILGLLLLPPPLDGRGQRGFPGAPCKRRSSSGGGDHRRWRRASLLPDSAQQQQQPRAALGRDDASLALFSLSSPAGAEAASRSGARRER